MHNPKGFSRATPPRSVVVVVRGDVVVATEIIGF